MSDSGGFAPTHVAPPDGLQAWEAPDPARPVIAQIQPGVQMQLVERRGAWARVVFSNGWSGWVDGRRIVDAAAPPPPPPVAPRPQPADRPAQEPVADRPQPRRESQAREPGREAVPEREAVAREREAVARDPREAVAREPRREPAREPHREGRPEHRREREPERRRSSASYHDEPTGIGALVDRLPAIAGLQITLALLGAAAVILGSLLSWIRYGGSKSNAFEVPVKFLWDYETVGAGGLKVGLVLVALAVAIGVFAILPGRVVLRRIFGAIISAVAILYSVQLQRALSAVDGTPSLTSAIGFGVIITLIGGIAIVLDGTEPQSR